MATFDARDLNLHIDKTELKPLYQIDPWRHAADMLFNWIIIGATIYLSNSYFNPLLYVLAIIIIGARMHALAILMHDATHFRFLRNKKLSDLLTNFISMYPLFSSIEQYRPNHLSHHRHLNTHDDPDWFAKLGRKEFQFPKTKREFILTVLAYFTLVSGVKDAIWFLKRFGSDKNVKRKKKSSTFQTRLPRIIFYVLLITVLSVFGWWLEYLMYWVIPYLSTFFMFQYIRSVAEHFGELAYDNLLNATRTVKVNAIERFFFAPHNVGYHLEHHLYPGVPYYYLPRLHQLLMKDDYFHAQAHITHGYIAGLMNELGSVETKTDTLSPSHI